MIDPTETDIGRRVRWLSGSFGTLTEIDGKAVHLALDPDERGQVLTVKADLTACHWADDNLGQLQTGAIARARQQK